MQHCIWQLVFVFCALLRLQRGGRAASAPAAATGDGPNVRAHVPTEDASDRIPARAHTDRGSSHAVARAAPAAATFPPHLVGTAPAAAALLERMLPGSSAHFELALVARCPGVAPGKACFTLADGAGAKTQIGGTSASELTAGIGVYLREYCNMTIGWPRGGGSRVFVPSQWPKVGAPVSRPRSVPYSHVTQVCTHSYTLVWYDWGAWEAFIDWMAPGLPASDYSVWAFFVEALVGACRIRGIRHANDI